MKRRPVTLCGKDLGGAAHVCAFFDSKQQQYDTLLPYFAEGLANHEQVVTILDHGMHGDHLARMRRAELPVDVAVASGQLKVMSCEETYTHSGEFVVDSMYALLVKTLEDARASSYAGVRTCGDMDWAIDSVVSTDRLMEYEARVNLLLPEHDCTLMCLYDVNRFSGRVILDVLSTHTHVILGGEVRENPYCLPPLEFLRSLVRRGSSPLARQLA